MPHFFIKKEEILRDLINLCDVDTVFHIVNVRRSKIGEVIKFIDEDKNVYLSEIVEISKKNLKAKIIDKQKSDRFLKNNICLIQSILASDAQNLLIANATQTGVKEIYPVISDNVSVKIKNTEKWQKIADENFKQCERADFVKIQKVMPLGEALKQFKKENILIFAEKDSNISIEKSLEDVDKNLKIVVVIGPEGGFSDNEFDYFKKEKYKLISLGPMIYKAPNAVVAGISNICSRLE